MAEAILGRDRANSLLLEIVGVLVQHMERQPRHTDQSDAEAWRDAVFYLRQVQRCLEDVAGEEN